MEALQVQFAPTPFDDPVADFTKLRQTSTVEEYQIDFEVLSNRILGLPEEFGISIFLSGLRDDIWVMVTMFRPTTLPTAFGLARLYEEVWRRFKNQKNSSTFHPVPINQIPPKNNFPRLPAPNPTGLLGPPTSSLPLSTKQRPT